MTHTRSPEEQRKLMDYRPPAGKVREIDDGLTQLSPCQS